jgi:hypothetical protein
MAPCNDHWLIDIRGAEEHRSEGRMENQSTQRVMGKMIIKGKSFSLLGIGLLFANGGCASPDLLGRCGCVAPLQEGLPRNLSRPIETSDAKRCTSSTEERNVSPQTG